jgi:hypothetical protein
MLKITDDNIKGLEVNFELSERDRQLLSGHIRTEGFDILQRLMEQEIRLLNVKLLNTNTANPPEILANHAVAKGAAMFYAGIMQRIAEVMSQEQIAASGLGTPTNPEKPPLVDDWN